MSCYQQKTKNKAKIIKSPRFLTGIALPKLKFQFLLNW